MTDTDAVPEDAVAADALAPTTSPAIVAAAPVAPRWLRVLRNPLIRILVFVLMLVALSLLVRRISGLPRLGLNAAADLSALQLGLAAVVAIVPALLAYWLLVRGIEGRRVDELAWRKLLPHSALGLLAGVAMMGAAAGLMALFGSYRINGVNAEVDLVVPLLVIGLIPGVVEEVIFRGVMFRVVEDALGTWIAIAISGAFFGLIHLGNPNATLWSSCAIALEAGILLGMLYSWTRSLYFVMGLHAAWNFTQGAVLDIAVSGVDLRGLFEASTQGHELLSGGEFGAEASVLTVALCLVVSIEATRRAYAAVRVVRPYWARTTPIPSGLPADTAS